MKDDELLICDAVESDAPFIALVVAMALGGDEKHFLYEVFCKLSVMENSQYSYRNSMVAKVNGKNVAAIVAYDGALLHQLREPLQELIKAHLGHTMDIEDETSAGEYYIDSFAVLPQYRNRGIGRRLLMAMRDKVFSKGYERLGLIVDFDNPKAEQLYASMGFVRINETTFLGHKMWHMQVNKS